MNYKAINGYLLSLVMMETKHQEEKLQGSFLTLKNALDVRMRVICKANKINITKQIDKIWNEFVNLSKDGEYEVSELMLALQLIISNPNRNKNKTITQLANEIAKEHRFSRDIQIKNSKILVHRFYIGVENV